MKPTTKSDRETARDLARRGWPAWEIAETLHEDGLDEATASKLATAAVEMMTRRYARRHPTAAADDARNESDR